MMRKPLSRFYPVLPVMHPYSPQQISRVLILISLCFTLASELGNVVTYDPGNPDTYRLGPAFPQKNRYIEWLSLDFGRSLPAWYTALLFLADALLIGALAVRAVPRYVQAVYWLGLSIFFAGLFLDKLIQLHLLVPAALRNRMAAGWMLWGIPGSLVAYASFRLLPPRLLGWFGLAGALFAGSYATDRLGEEFAGQYSGHHMVAALMGDAEGTMEMLGAVAVLHGVLIYGRNRSDGR
jgi:hypothetical protein